MLLSIMMNFLFFFCVNMNHLDILKAAIVTAVVASNTNGESPFAILDEYERGILKILDESKCVLNGSGEKSLGEVMRELGHYLKSNISNLKNNLVEKLDTCDEEYKLIELVLDSYITDGTLFLHDCNNGLQYGLTSKLDIDSTDMRTKCIVFDYMINVMKTALYGIRNERQAILKILPLINK